MIADNLVGSEEAVFDALLEFVSVNRLSEVGDVGGVFRFLRSGSEADLDRSIKVVEDFPPCGIFGGAATVALIDNDEVKEVSGDAFEDFILLVGTGERLIEAEVDLVGWIDLSVFDLGHDRAEGLEVIDEGLVGEDVSINEKESALGSPCLPESPNDLEDGVGLACARGHDEEETAVAFGNGFHDAVDRLALVVAGLFSVGVEVVRFEDELFFLVLDVSVLFVAFPNFVW